MKRYSKISGLALMLIFAMGTAMFAQRPVRGALDTTRLGRRGGVGFNQSREDFQKADSLWFRWPRHRIGPMGMWPGMRGMWNMPYYRFRHDFRPGMGFGPGWDRAWPGIPGWERRVAPGRPFIGRIPDLTEKQKEQIKELIQKQQDEIQKAREENLKKMEEIRKTHRENILKLLTPEQKKWFEENSRPVVPQLK